MSRSMRPSRVLKKMRNGETAIALKLNLADARVAEIVAMLGGVDCLWTDMEHVPNDWSTIEKQIWAAKGYDVDVLVRVARGSYSDLIRPLEMDASGIMIPHVMSLAEAKQVVRQTKFHPIGLRALDGGNADGSFCTLPLLDYMREANEQRFNVLQIEDPEPLSELEEIIALPGVDMVFFGPGDFSQAIGAPGQWDHPLISETRIKIAQLAHKHGKFAGTLCPVANLPNIVSMGYNFVSVGADVIGVTQYLEGIVQALSQQESNKNSNASIYGG